METMEINSVQLQLRAENNFRAQAQVIVAASSAHVRGHAKADVRGTTV
jgi:hypothetical protein